MSRNKVARVGLVLVLLLLCGTGGYLAHFTVRKYPLAQMPLTLPLDQEFEPKPKIPLRPLGRSAEWAWPPRVPQIQLQADQSKAEEERLIFGKDGLVRNWDDGSEAKTRGYTRLSSRVRHVHPIHQLIERGQDKWRKLLERWVVVSSMQVSRMPAYY